MRSALGRVHRRHRLLAGSDRDAEAQQDVDQGADVSADDPRQLPPAAEHQQQIARGGRALRYGVGRRRVRQGRHIPAGEVPHHPSPAEREDVLERPRGLADRREDLHTLQAVLVANPLPAAVVARDVGEVEGRPGARVAAVGQLGAAVGGHGEAQVRGFVLPLLRPRGGAPDVPQIRAARAAAPRRPADRDVAGGPRPVVRACAGLDHRPHRSEGHGPGPLRGPPRCGGEPGSLDLPLAGGAAVVPAAAAPEPRRLRQGVLGGLRRAPGRQRDPQDDHSRPRPPRRRRLARGTAAERAGHERQGQGRLGQNGGDAVHLEPRRRWPEGPAASLGRRPLHEPRRWSRPHFLWGPTSRAASSPLSKRPRLRRCRRAGAQTLGRGRGVLAWLGT
mmetsp:Transcript_45267/g.127493  ORF Transcript_45267/g.127493 Transcript_45267/m.127493 type:complete len:390 (+) Transcript_45267:332-1501(+)